MTRSLLSDATRPPPTGKLVTRCKATVRSVTPTAICTVATSAGITRSESHPRLVPHKASANALRQLWVEEVHDAAFMPGCVDLATATNFILPSSIGSDEHDGEQEHKHETDSEMTSQAVSQDRWDLVLPLAELVATVLVSV